MLTPCPGRTTYERQQPDGHGRAGSNKEGVHPEPEYDNVTIIGYVWYVWYVGYDGYVGSHERTSAAIFSSTFRAAIEENWPAIARSSYPSYPSTRGPDA